MPFLEPGAGAADHNPPTTRLVFDPAKILQLKQGFEDERDKIRNWLRQNSVRLSDVPSPGEDPCSKDTVKILSENGQTAVDAVRGYVTELDNVAAGLHDSAVAYGLVEEENTYRFRQEPE